MGDLDIRFSNENESKKLNSSLDLRLNNGQFEKIEDEKPKPTAEEILKEEYYENLFEEISDEAVEEAEEQPETEEISEELTEEIGEAEEISETEELVEEEISDADEFTAEETLEGVTSQLADEIFEEIEAENAVSEEETAEDVDETEGISEEADETDEPAEENEEILEEATETEEKEEVTEEVGEEADVSDEEKPVFDDEKVIVSEANAVNDTENPTDEVLSELSFDTQKGKYDFINLCVLAIMLVFVSLTFILMKQALASDEKNELTVETIKTGEYTKSISEKYYENLPMEKIMAQAEVVVKKLFGDKDVKFLKFRDNEPPDGPIDNVDVGGMTVDDDEEAVVTTTVTVSVEVTTTAKLPQDFEITTAEQKDDNSPLFTGRPIKTTTTKVTTTLDLPKTTEDTTTGKVDLIFP